MENWNYLNSISDQKMQKLWIKQWLRSQLPGLYTTSVY